MSKKSEFGLEDLYAHVSSELLKQPKDEIDQQLKEIDDQLNAFYADASSSVQKQIADGKAGKGLPYHQAIQRAQSTRKAADDQSLAFLLDVKSDLLPQLAAHYFSQLRGIRRELEMTRGWLLAINESKNLAEENLDFEKELKLNRIQSAADGRKKIGAASRAKIAKAAEAFRHLSKGNASYEIADIVSLDPGTIKRYLSELFPGDAWKQ